MTLRPDAILFDLDGTLLDSLASIGLAMNEALSALALPTHPIEAYKRFVGDGVRVLAERVLPAAQLGRVNELLAAYKPRYRDRQLDAALYEGVEGTLEALQSLGISLAVLTNKPDDLAGEIVASVLPKVRFAVVRGERDGVPKKPDPTQALELASLMNARPERCWFVGDTPTDVRTARNAGMRCIAVLWGFRGREELSESGATVFIARPRELLSLLGD